LDSRAAFPHLGTVVVLAATALEVFIANLLDTLVKETDVPERLWSWMNKRGKFDQEPSVEEQFDTLLEVMTGHSLKDDLALWDAFQNLKTARNKFVHEGIPRIGKNAPPISELEALSLVGQAESIVAKIREWIPEKHRWPLYVPKSAIGFRMPLFEQPKNTQTLALDPSGTDGEYI
jgi:hypothetical protein